MSNQKFEKHVFVCSHERDENSQRGCCMSKNSLELMVKLKTLAKNSGLVNIRVQKSGCLDHCEFGPTCVVYPEGTWYTYLDEEDIDEIIQSHLIKGVLVERLRIKG